MQIFHYNIKNILIYYFVPLGLPKSSPFGIEIKKAIDKPLPSRNNIFDYIQAAQNDVDRNRTPIELTVWFNEQMREWVFGNVRMRMNQCRPLPRVI